VHSFAEALYERLPIFLQNAACCYYGWKEGRVRFGDEFDRRLEWLQQSQFWSASEIEAYQDEQVRTLVQHAYQTVPYYREVMKERKLHPADIAGVRDLAKLPILTKEDVRQNSQRLISTAADLKSVIERHTSGTTGKSLLFYSTPASIGFQWAVWARHRLRFGIAPFTWHANFTGKRAVPPEQQRPPYWRWNWPMHQVVLTMHHMTPAKAPAVAGFLNRHEFLYYSGYPSVLHAFAMSAADAGVRLERPPKFIVTGAENMLDYQRADLEAFTGATLTDQYGMSEGCGNASHCEHLRYHEDHEFAVLECGEPQAGDEGRSRGKILCTGFANPAFPLIRYDVGDTAVWESESHRCRCGRQSRVINRIEGRQDDYVITPEGRRIMRFDYLFKETPNVRESQIVQNRPGEICVRIVQRPGYSTVDEQYITAEIARWISPRLRIHFEYVAEIEREPGGKLRAVRSHLPRADAVATGSQGS